MSLLRKTFRYVFWDYELDPQEAYNKALSELNKRFSNYDVIKAEVQRKTPTRSGDSAWLILVEVNDA